MNQLSKAGASPVIRVVDGQSFEFPKLKRKQIAKLTSKWAEEDRVLILSALDQAGATTEIKASTLISLLQETRTLQFGYNQLIQSYKRCDESILESLRNDDPSITEDDLDDLPFNQAQLVDIAIDTWMRLPTVKEGEKQNPNQ